VISPVNASFANNNRSIPWFIYTHRRGKSLNVTRIGRTVHVAYINAFHSYLSNKTDIGLIYSSIFSCVCQKTAQGYRHLFSDNTSTCVYRASIVDRCGIKFMILCYLDVYVMHRPTSAGQAFGW